MLPPFETTICGLDELPGHGERGITHVLSILDPEYPVPDAFGSYGEHERLELRFHDIIQPKLGETPPGPQHVERLLAFGATLKGPAEQHLLVHCHAGVSRSTASMALILAQAAPAMPAAEIGEELLRIRSQSWPNLLMIEMGDAALGRGGSLIEAAIAIYREQLRRRPELADLMRGVGRAREVELARALP